MQPTLYFTSPCSAHYQRASLDREDQERLFKTPHLEQKADWQSSRFLKQFLPNPRPPFSLSHKQGYAALFTASGLVGVDLERLKKREFATLLPWFCTTCEMDFFWQQENQTLAFYQLWTLKEALIKALQKDFSALKTVGLKNLQTDNWQVFSYLIKPYWLITAVVSHSELLSSPIIKSNEETDFSPLLWEVKK